ncbi:MAG: flagellar assembly protein FliX [Pseudomonadota bacterium]
MRIDNNRPIGAVKHKKSSASSAASDASFNINDGLAGETAAASPVSAAANLDALLSLQSVDDATSGRRRAAKQGFDLLDRLEDMRLGLLNGKLSSTQIQRLIYKVQNLPRTGDERLDSLLDDIDLRARVELAKLGVFEF